MTLRTRIGAGITLSLVCLMPLAANAVTPDVGLPEKETPVTETPVTETPVTETPVTETPVTETPVTETPVTETPVTENPEREVKRNDPLTKEKTTTKTRNPGREVVVTPRNKVETMVYPQPSAANFCPQGLQPVTISGVISCGSPNKTVTYQQMLKNPARAVRKTHKPKRTTYHRSAVPTCTPGLKGCSDR